ncbi:MAG: thiamine diphosphokinase [Bacteroidetes bacterium]|nr:thiamine diphosphokinase [Bacteroidota bacterium]
MLCDGEKPSVEQLHALRMEDTLVIAADGGGNIGKDWEIRPDLIIGDLDSDDGSWPEVKRLYDPDQDTNDLEKALEYAHVQGVSRITIIGGTGERLDHTLKNLSVMVRYKEAFEGLVLLDNYMKARLISSPFTMSTWAGMKVSLVAASGKVTGIVSEGLLYPWSGQDLIVGHYDGTSNQATGEQVTLRFEEGDLLLIVPLDGQSRRVAQDGQLGHDEPPGHAEQPPAGRSL